MPNTIFDPASRGAHVTLSAGNLRAASTATGDTGARSIDTNTSGLYYFEMTVDNVSGGDTGIGIGNVSATFAGMGSNAANGAMVYISGNVWFNGSFSGFNAGALVAGDVVGIELDLTAGTIRFRKLTGIQWNGSGTPTPATPSTGIDISAILGSAVAPIICLGASGAQITANFGDSVFPLSLPGGYTAGWPGGGGNTTFDPGSIGANVTLSGGDLTAASSAAGDTGAKSIDTKSSGLLYSEFSFDNIAGTDTGVGIGNTSATYAGMGASATNGVMVFKSGNIWYNGSFTGLNIGAFAAGDVGGMALDLTNSRIWFRRIVSAALSISAITGSGIAPIICLGDNGAQITANFGDTAFVGSVPSGFTAGWPGSAHPLAQVMRLVLIG